jgi:hypothetical protein
VSAGKSARTETTVSDALQILPFFIFMLIPIMIPVIAAAFGALADLIAAHVSRKN